MKKLKEDNEIVVTPNYKNPTTNNELVTFFHRNNIFNIGDFIKKYNFKIEKLQTSVSNSEFNYAEFSEENQVIIPLSKIFGFSDSHINIDNSYFSNFSNFFNSRKNEQYYNRAISMLEYSSDEIINKLSKSFEDEPICTISIDGKYYISSNGLHRFMVLKLYYMLELYNGKTIEELDNKYMIKISNKELNTLKLFTDFFCSNFNPPIKYNDCFYKSQIMGKIKERLKKLNESDYKLLIDNISFTHFINDTCGEVVIKYLFENFPNIAMDIYKHLIATNNYDCTTNIFNCAEKYFPNYIEQLIQLINKNMNCNLNDINDESNYKYFDLKQKWSGYGTTKNISDKSQNAKLFSEGSEGLEKCLKIIWEQGIETTACCKGNHLSINIYNEPEVNCEAYISFSNNQNWQNYLSENIIKSDDVIITENAIYYYGSNNESFFKMLGKDFLTGRKNNDNYLNNKNTVITKELEYNSFIYALLQIGFDKEQVQQLSNDYLEMQKASDEFYLSTDVEREKTRQKLNEIIKCYKNDLVFYINRNNQKLKNDVNVIDDNNKSNNDSELFNSSVSISNTKNNGHFNEDLSMMRVSEVRMNILLYLIEQYNKGISLPPITPQELIDKFNINERIAQQLTIEINSMIEAYIQEKKQESKNYTPYILDDFSNEIHNYSSKHR